MIYYQYLLSIHNCNVCFLFLDILCLINFSSYENISWSIMNSLIKIWYLKKIIFCLWHQFFFLFDLYCGCFEMNYLNACGRLRCELIEGCFNNVNDAALLDLWIKQIIFMTSKSILRKLIFFLVTTARIH